MRFDLEELQRLLVERAPEDDDRWWDIIYLTESVATAPLANNYLMFEPDEPGGDATAHANFVRSWPWGTEPGDKTGRTILDPSKDVWNRVCGYFADCRIIEVCEIPF